MHELTLCSNALEIMEHHAKKQGAKRITAAWFEIGPFSCVETDSLIFCFELVCRGTMAEGCELHLIQPQATAYCLDCKQNVTLDTTQGKICPSCGSVHLQMDTHDQMQIKQIEVK